MLIIVVAFGVAAIVRGQDISRVGLNGDISFYPRGGSAEASQEVRERQQRLDEEISERERAAREAGGASAAPHTADLNGVWAGTNGLRYGIEQYGADAFMVEMGGSETTAYAYGTVTGDQFRFQFQSVDGTVGTGTLTMVDSRTLEGSCTDGASTVSLELTR
ncbi:MAG TPA: hypothetical protein VE617_09910 [Propionibacteriaceae bacterium]|nr:hypothetical protein [Propionibacteriaceae bacterium]